MSEKSKKNQTIQYYDQNAAYFVENTRDVDFHVIQDEFLEKLPAEAQILDLGCGSGRDTKYFLDFTEEKLEQLLKKHTSLQQLRNFLTEDVRPDREERWLNLFLKKINS